MITHGRGYFIWAWRKMAQIEDDVKLKVAEDGADYV